MNLNNVHSIGVFDSGVGGAYRCPRPHGTTPFENIIYFGDTAVSPIRHQIVETITRYATQITEFS